MTVDVPGQHVLERTSCSISSQVISPRQPRLAQLEDVLLPCPANSQVKPWGDLILYRGCKLLSVTFQREEQRVKCGTSVNC